MRHYGNSGRSQFKYEDLPEELKGDIVVTLRKGEHRGRSQLFAYVKSFKLVVEPGSRTFPQEGETWQVSIRGTPNGHVFFCTARRLKKTVEGEHPVIARAKDYVGKRVNVTVRGKKGWLREGTLRSVTCEDGVLKFALDEDTTERGNDPNVYTPRSQIGAWVAELPEDSGHKLGVYGRYLITGYLSGDFNMECTVCLYTESK